MSPQRDATVRTWPLDSALRDAFSLGTPYGKIALAERRRRLNTPAE
ncbi:MAG TPA: hypothetical protein VJW73_20755 [Gemmatimonadaceae bacterium]|nr:hypothetical protein [Gemmatimonadaceae bacterium]